MQKPTTYLILVLILAAVLRVLTLGSESFWIDELITLSRIQKSIWQIGTDWDSATQGSLYYVVQKGWFYLIGGNEITLRISAVIYGTLAVLALYHLGRKLFNSTVGLYGALFLAVNPFAIFYAQEARPYSLFLLLSICSYYLALKLLERYGKRDAVLYVACLAAALYTHPFGIFLLASHVILPFVFRGNPGYTVDPKFLKRIFILWGAVCLLYIPQCIRFAFSFLVKLAGGTAANWIPVPSWPALYSEPLHYFMWPVLGTVLYCLLIAAVLIHIVQSHRSRGVIYLLCVYGCFWILPWIESRYLTSLYVPRYTLPALGAVTLLMGWAVTQIPKWPRIALTILLLMATVVPLKAYYTKVDKDPWRQAAIELRPRLEQGDIVIAIPWWTGDHVKHYLAPLGEAPVLRIPKSDRLAENVAGHDRVWLVESYEPKPDWIAALKEAMKPYQAGETVNMLERLELNPYNLGVSPIRFTLYTLQSSDSTSSN